MGERFFPAAASVLLLLSFVAGSKAADEASGPQSVVLPQISDRAFNIVDYGAVGDGTKLNTSAIEKAIDACKQAGGGRLRIPAGQFLTGPFSLISNLNLHLDDGAVLRLSNNPADFQMKKNHFQDCIDARDCHDIAITGNGTIDGQGEIWWKKFRASKESPEGGEANAHRPFLVTLRHCERVLVQNVTLMNSPMFHLVPQGCTN